MSTLSVSLSRKELFLRACRGEALPRVPVWMMRQAGRYLPEYRELRAKHAFLEVCKTPELAVEVSLQAVRRFGVDAVIVFSDIFIVAGAMGVSVGVGDEGAKLSRPVRTASGVAKVQQFALPAVQEVIRGVIGAAPVIYYTKASHHLLPAVVESGANVLSVDWRVNLAELRRMAGPRVGIQGNLDPALLYAPQDVLRAKTTDVLQELSGVGHILNLGHGILPTTPVENAQIFIQTGQQTNFAARTTASVVR